MIYHRWISPLDSRCLGVGWEVKLSDFGLVGLLEDTWKQSHEVSKPTKVTPTQADKSGVPAEEKENISEVVNIQTLCGSSYYIAPEIVLRERSCFDSCFKQQIYPKFVYCCSQTKMSQVRCRGGCLVSWCGNVYNVVWITTVWNLPSYCSRLAYNFPSLVSSLSI